MRALLLPQQFPGRLRGGEAGTVGEEMVVEQGAPGAEREGPMLGAAGGARTFGKKA